MAMHLWLMLLILIITAGVVLIQLLLRLYRTYRSPYLKSAFLFNIAYLIEFLLIFNLFYIAINLPGIWTPQIPGVLSMLFSISPKPFGLLYFFYLVKTIYNLRGKKLPAWFNGTIVLLLSLFLLDIFRILFIAKGTVLESWLYQICDFPFLTMNPLLILLLIPLLGRKAKSIAPQIAHPFALMFFSRQLFNQIAILTLYYLEYRNLESVHTLSVVFHTFYVALTFILMFYWLNRKVIPYHRDLVDHSVTGVAVDSLRERYKLSDREVEVSLQIIYGKSNKEIAVQLNLSASTVKNYIYNLYQKIGISSRFELINLVQNITNSTIH